MKIGVIGYGFGKFLTGVLSASHGDLQLPVRVVNRLDPAYRNDLDSCNDETHYKLYLYENITIFAKDLDVIVLAVSIASLEDVLGTCPLNVFSNQLVVDVCSVKVGSTWCLSC